MKVFLSWSGGTSQKVALVLREWIPSVLQNVEPYLSSEDIDKGARWSADIAKELEGTSFGILCVTKENIDAPWLNFEAGALSKFFDKSHVVPLLFDLKPTDVRGPLVQFQSASCSKDEVKRLVASVNKSAGAAAIPEKRLEKVFDVWWPELESSLDAVRSHVREGTTATRDAPRRDVPSILEELLTLVRSQHKLLSSPETLLPLERLSAAIGLAGSQQVLRQLAQSEAPAPSSEVLRASRSEELMRLLTEGKKINAIKLLREVTGLGLRDTKNMIEAIEQAYKPKPDA